MGWGREGGGGVVAATKMTMMLLILKKEKEKKVIQKCNLLSTGGDAETESQTQRDKDRP